VHIIGCRSLNQTTFTLSGDTCSACTHAPFVLVEKACSAVIKTFADTFPSELLWTSAWYRFESTELIFSECSAENWNLKSGISTRVEKSSAVHSRYNPLIIQEGGDKQAIEHKLIPIKCVCACVCVGRKR
jgi:hypothetical protein